MLLNIYTTYIINCIVDCYTAIIWGSLNNKHDRTVFKTRFHFFEPSIQIEIAHWEGTLLRAQILNQCSDMYVPNSTQRIIICTWFTTCNRQSALTRRCHSKYPLINDSGLASLFTSKQFSFRQVVNMVRLNNVNFVNKASKFVKEKKTFVELSRLNCNLLQSKKTNFKKEPTSIIDFWNTSIFSLSLLILARPEFSKLKLKTEPVEECQVP